MKIHERDLWAIVLPLKDGCGQVREAIRELGKGEPLNIRTTKDILKVALGSLDEATKNIRDLILTKRADKSKRA